jgi:hypothetical protein
MGAKRRNQTWNRREPVRSNPKVFGGPDVFFTIIGKEQCTRWLSRSCDCGFKNLPVRFQRTHDVRKNLHVKILKNRVVLLNVIDVGFVGVGDQNQWVTLAEILEKGFGNQKVREEYGRPGFVEIREVHLKLAGFAEIPVVIGG